jgi:hypothetical protein
MFLDEGAYLRTQALVPPVEQAQKQGRRGHRRRRHDQESKHST